MKKKHRCANCGGTLVNEMIRYDKHWGDEIVIFEDVPAEVCTQCDEVWLDGKTVEKMDRLLFRKTRPTRMLSVPTWSLKRAA